MNLRIEVKVCQYDCLRESFNLRGAGVRGHKAGWLGWRGLKKRSTSSEMLLYDLTVPVNRNG